LVQISIHGLGKYESSHDNIMYQIGWYGDVVDYFVVVNLVIWITNHESA
jgi:hypothetical protein